MPRTEFTPTPPHPARWHEESLDDDPDPRPRRGCHADDWPEEPAVSARSSEPAALRGLEPAASRSSEPAAPRTSELRASRRPEPATRRAESATRPWLSDPPDVTERWHQRLVPARFQGTRWDPGPRGALILAALGVIAVLLAATASFQQQPVSRPVPPISPAAATDTNREHGGPSTPAALDPSGGQASAAPGVGGPNAGGPGPVGRTAPPATANGQASTATEVVVSVVGLVEHGGLRRFPPGARIADAVKAATPHPEADLSGLNLAQPLRDGDQIVIGRTDPTPDMPQLGSTLTTATHTTGAGPATESTRPTGAPARVNLNTATEAELDALPGVGPVTARAILTWRTQHGRFTSVDQLAEVDGIGPARLARLRNSVTI